MASSDGGASRLGRAEPPAGAHATADPGPEGCTTGPTSESPADLAQSFFSDDPSPGGPAIGRATALRLAAEGHRVTAVDLVPGLMERACRDNPPSVKGWPLRGPCR